MIRLTYSGNCIVEVIYADIVLSLVLIVLSAVWAWIGIFRLGLWIPGVSADSGFIPTVFSAVTLICAVIMLVQAIKKRAAGQTSPVAEGASASSAAKAKVLAFIRKYSVVLFGAFGALCLQFLGLIPMSFLLIFGWLKLMSQYAWVKSIAVAAIVTVAIYLVFDVWLQIPFPGLI